MLSLKFNGWHVKRCHGTPKLSNLPIFSNDQFSGAMLVSASVTEGEPTKGYAWLSRGSSRAWHCLAVQFFVVLVTGWRSTLEPKQYRSVLYIPGNPSDLHCWRSPPPKKKKKNLFKTRVIWVLGIFFYVGSFAKSSSGRKPISMALLRMWVAHPSWTASWFIEIWIVPLSQVVVSHEQCSAGDVLFQTNWWQIGFKQKFCFSPWFVLRWSIFTCVNYLCSLSLGYYYEWLTYPPDVHP